MISSDKGRVQIEGVRIILMADLHSLLKGLMKKDILPYGVIKAILETARCEAEGIDSEEAYNDTVKAMIEDVAKKLDEEKQKSESVEEESQWTETLTMDADVIRMVMEGLR